MSSALKRLALTCTALTALGNASFAADLPLKAVPKATAPVVYPWTGYYIGLHAGFGFPTDDYATMQRFSGSAVHPLQSAEQDIFVFGGGQFGHSWRFGQWVAGIEADVSVRSGAADLLAEGPITMTIDKSGNVFGTVRGRVGWLWQERYLTYITGGLAYGQDKFDSTILGPGPVGVFNFSEDSWQVGWVAGAGVEMGLDARWSAKLEYQYVALDSLSSTFIKFTPGGKGNSGRFTARGSDDAHTVRMGLNYHFWGS